MWTIPIQKTQNLFSLYLPVTSFMHLMRAFIPIMMLIHQHAAQVKSWTAFKQKY